MGLPPARAEQALLRARQADAGHRSGHREAGCKAALRQSVADEATAKGRGVDEQRWTDPGRAEARRGPGPQPAAAAPGRISSARRRSRRTCGSSSRPPASGARCWTTCCCTGRRAGQDHPGPDPGRGDGPGDPPDQRSGLHQQRRAHRPAERAGRPPGHLHRRDPPPGPGHRGAPLSGHGGLAGRADHRQGAQRPALQSAARTLHPDRGHHAGRV